jgi:Raf kinase inhibitor-like YbhB/YbcL family protein
MHLCEPITPFRHVHISAGILWKILLLLVLLLAAPFLAGCRHNESVAIASGAAFTLSSTSLQNGKFPKEFTCDGADESPALTWTAPPGGTKALALTVTDPDAPSGTFTHWILYNLPASSSSLSAGVPKQTDLSDGSHQGRNDFGRPGYGGPCPPPGKPHRYVFTLYALDRSLDAPANASRTQLEAGMQGHILAKGELTARYGR